MTRNPGKLSDQMRAAVEASGMSRYRICKTVGIAESTLSRFMSDKGGLSMQVMDDIAELLGLRICTGKTRRTISATGRTRPR